MKRLFFISLSSLFIVGCSVLDTLPAPKTYGLTPVLIKKPSNKILPNLIQCIEPSLKEKYPAASLTLTMENLYEGKIPGADPDSPIATFDIFAKTGTFQGYVSLYQKEPVNPAITAIFTDCL
ncbi:hypothetical protein F9B74_03710 [Pelistega sp. NLN82]|uniref:Lipoprotein n=1 Tax=Pelistega ratti TaxID=2652177 RepID=A0A6L9Y4Z8_9BURK|nr:hypothetical protein [Pelistega ratti]NEN75433.1 hypothetical protein [Pelistega ratti]